MGNSESNVNEPCINCMTQRDQKEQSYKTYIKQECEDLVGQCLWAEFLLKKIKKLKKYPIQKFYEEIFILNQQYNIQQQQQQNNNYKSNIRGSICEEEKEEDLKKLIKRSELLEEDIIDNNANSNGSNKLRKSFNDRQSYRTSYSKNSSTPSFAFQEKQFILKQIESEPQLKQKIEQQVKYFLSITNLLKQHLLNNQHQLHHILNIFIACFIQNYQNQNQNLLIQGLFDIQQFTRVYLQSISIYYDINKQRSSNSQICILLTDENLLNFIVNLIFQDNVYKIFYNLVKDKQQDEVNKLKQNMERVNGLRIDEFGIKDKYQLNYNTYRLLNNGNEYKESKEIPYLNSIKTLDQIQNKLSPTSKMKVIIKASQQLVKCIRRFYQQNGGQFDGIIDSDDILSIQTYILAKSQLSDISIHIYIIEKLATNRLLIGTSGYYLITLQAAIENINNQLK